MLRLLGILGGDTDDGSDEPSAMRGALLGGDTNSPHPCAKDVANLRREADELRAKVEAMRAAEYREDQRKNCVATMLAERQDHGSPASAATGSDSAAGSSAAGAVDIAGGDHAQSDDGGDLDAMYDFSSFLSTPSPSHGQPGRKRTGSSKEEVDDPVGTWRRLAAVEGQLRRREEVLESQSEAQRRKVANASEALQRTRGHVQQLKEQISLKEAESVQLGTQAAQLHRLLEEKERRLQAVLEEAGTATTHSESGLDRSAQEIEDGVTQEHMSWGLGPQGEQQPQEAPQEPTPQKPTPEGLWEVGASCKAGAAADSEDQLMQLARITEELTDALELAREGEEDAQRQLEAAALDLANERELRAHQEGKLAAARESRDAEVAALLARLQEQEQTLAFERNRVNELEELAKRRELEERQRMKEFEDRKKRQELEECLEKALAKKGKNRFHHHLEV